MPVPRTMRTHYWPALANQSVVACAFGRAAMRLCSFGRQVGIHPDAFQWRDGSRGIGPFATSGNDAGCSNNSWANEFHAIPMQGMVARADEQKIHLPYCRKLSRGVLLRADSLRCPTIRVSQECNANHQHDEFFIQNFIHDAADAYPELPEPPQVALLGPLPDGVNRPGGRSLQRCAFGPAWPNVKTPSPRGLIRIEKLTPDLAPVQHRVRGIAEPVYGEGDIVKVLEIVFDGLADDIRPGCAGAVLLPCPGPPPPGPAIAR